MFRAQTNTQNSTIHAKQQDVSDIRNKLRYRIHIAFYAATTCERICTIAAKQVIRSTIENHQISYLLQSN